jgi:hypothetical protein
MKCWLIPALALSLTACSSDDGPSPIEAQRAIQIAAGMKVLQTRPTPGQPLHVPKVSDVQLEACSLRDPDHATCPVRYLLDGASQDVTVIFQRAAGKWRASPQRA